jgi:hypothetical protein
MDTESWYERGLKVRTEDEAPNESHELTPPNDKLRGHAIHGRVKRYPIRYYISPSELTRYYEVAL